MKKLIKLEDAIGKTITGFRAWNQDILIVFEDSYSNYQASGYEGADFYLRELEFNCNEEKQIGLDLGLVSAEEIKELENQANLRAQQYEIARKQARREAYENLKKEFENENSI